MSIEYDLEGRPLQIKTDSAVGTWDSIALRLHTDTEGLITVIYVRLTDPPQYSIYYCTSSWTTFPVSLPAEQDKIWTFYKTDTALRIECNDVEVLNYLYSEVNDDDCVEKLGRDVEKIMFGSFDTASDMYRPRPGVFCELCVNC